MAALIFFVLLSLPSVVASAPHAALHILKNLSATALPHQFPWLVSIQVPQKGGNWQHVCGGSLIALRDGQVESDIVVTAAHCFQKCACPAQEPWTVTGGYFFKNAPPPRVYRIVVGEHALVDDTPAGGKEIFSNPASCRCHNFDRFTGSNDISLVKLSSPVKFTDNIRPIQLPPVQDADADYTAVSGCQVAGWGLTDVEEVPNEPRYANVTVYDQETCSNRWTGKKYDPDLMLCAGKIRKGDRGTMYQVACRGDSGGPLMCPKNENGAMKLVGVVSRVDMPGCLNLGISKPDTYTKVASYVEWIIENAQEMMMDSKKVQ